MSQELLLGKVVGYETTYNPSLLFPIKRSHVGQIKSDTNLAFKGFDIWNCYEASWLGPKGKPEVMVLQFFVPATSEYLPESKSVKLYLNSLNNTKFASKQEVEKTISNDLSKVTGNEVVVNLLPLSEFHGQSLVSFEGESLDDLDVEVSEYEFNRSLLKISSNNVVQETLYSDLLKSNCLVTGQPDWASVQIKYKGLQLDRASLLRYIVSFRNHNEFHEQCAERIFLDILNLSNPSDLTVYARYTRRGGIDINPIRSTSDLNVTELKNLRFVRQ